MGKFQGKIVIITGGSNGIGAATAIAFANEGANVVITGRNKDRLGQVAEKCRAVEGCQVLEIIGDLSEYKNLEPIVTKTVEKFGAVDILVNNAGYAIFRPLDLLTKEQFERVFDTNMRGPAFLCQYALPHLRKTKGCIVNVSSSGAIETAMGGTAYNSSKAALDHFTRNLAAECVGQGVRVNGITPGMVQTGLINAMDIKEEMRQEVVKQLVSTQPLGIIYPEEIAEGILFLASAAKISGISLVIDGGRLVFAG